MNAERRHDYLRLRVVTFVLALLVIAIVVPPGIQLLVGAVVYLVVVLPGIR